MVLALILSAFVPATGTAAAEPEDVCATPSAITLGVDSFEYKPKNLKEAIQHRKSFYLRSSPNAQFRIINRKFRTYSGAILRFNDAQNCNVIEMIFIKEDGLLHQYSSVFKDEWYKSMKHFWFSIGK